MNDRLRMHHHLDLAGLHAEQPFRFDNLKAFVHHGRGVNGDLGSHLPVGMFQCLCLGDGLQLLQRAGPKRTTGSGQYHLLNRVPDFSS